MAAGLGPLAPMGSLAARFRPLLEKPLPTFLEAMAEIDKAGLIPHVMNEAEVTFATAQDQKQFGSLKDDPLSVDGIACIMKYSAEDTQPPLYKDLNDKAYMKDRTKHTVTLSDVVENERFAYAGPLTGSQLVAVHRLERCAEGTRITHSFEFTGFLGGIFRLAAAGPVQRGLEANTLMLRTLAEAAEEEPAAGGDESGS